MRYGIDLCTLGDFGEPATVVRVAQAAEAAGWEALLVWDHLAFAFGIPSTDPWVNLAAAAQATSRIRLGTAVTPLPRRRPVTVAHSVTTLDRLSGGRAILGVGLGGVQAEFTAFGETDDPRVRAHKLDESLDIIAGLWSGQPVTYAGEYYRVDGVTLAPLPVQRPRVPVWVGGQSRPAQRRAARWDGWIINGDDENGAMVVPPGKITADVAYLLGHRGPVGPFDVAMTGVSTGPADPVFGEYEAAGVTWWLEHIHGQRGSLPDLLTRIAAGPPR